MSYSVNGGNQNYHAGHGKGYQKKNGAQNGNEQECEPMTPDYQSVVSNAPVPTPPETGVPSYTVPASSSTYAPSENGYSATGDSNIQNLLQNLQQAITDSQNQSNGYSNAISEVETQIQSAINAPGKMAGRRLPPGIAKKSSDDLPAANPWHAELVRREQLGQLTQQQNALVQQASAQQTQSQQQILGMVLSLLNQMSAAQQQNGSTVNFQAEAPAITDTYATVTATTAVTEPATGTGPAVVTAPTTGTTAMSKVDLTSPEELRQTIQDYVASQPGDTSGLTNALNAKYGNTSFTLQADGSLFYALGGSNFKIASDGSALPVSA